MIMSTVCIITKWNGILFCGTETEFNDKMKAKPNETGDYCIVQLWNDGKLLIDRKISVDGYFLMPRPTLKL